MKGSVSGKHYTKPWDHLFSLILWSGLLGTDIYEVWLQACCQKGPCPVRSVDSLVEKHFTCSKCPLINNPTVPQLKTVLAQWLSQENQLLLANGTGAKDKLRHITILQAIC